MVVMVVATLLKAATAAVMVAIHHTATAAVTAAILHTVATVVVMATRPMEVTAAIRSTSIIMNQRIRMKRMTRFGKLLQLQWDTVTGSHSLMIISLFIMNYHWSITGCKIWEVISISSRMKTGR